MEGDRAEDSERIPQPPVHTLRYTKSLDFFARHLLPPSFTPRPMPSRPLVTAVTVALLPVTLLPAALVAQAPKARAFAKPAAELEEPYSGVRGVRELADGRLVVVDNRDKAVHLVDLSAQRVTPLGREGSGPNEYQMPSSAIALPGDTTLVGDPLNGRFLIVGPGGRLAGSWTPAGADAPMMRMSGPGGGPPSGGPPAGGARGGAGRGPGGAMMMAGGPMAMLSAKGADQRGRLYMNGQPIVMGPNGPTGADSVPIIRLTRGGTSRSDTVAWYRPQRANVNVSGGGNNTNMSIRIGATPFAPEDGWAVFPDGRVAVVRVADYHVDMYPTTGAPVRGPSVKTTAIRVTEAEKQAWRDTRNNAAPIAVAFRAGPEGTSRSAAPVPTRMPEPEEWPAVMPPFQASQVYALPNGQLWVGRYRAASDKSPRFDVFDAAGRLVEQVTFPPRTTIVGFGKRSVYTVRLDEDDLQYLQKYDLPQ